MGIKTLAIVIFLIIGINFSANAQQWVSVNQLTIAWDAVVPLESTDSISYYIYTKFVSTQEQLGSIDTPNGTALQETANLQATISFQTEGKYILGVATKRTLSDGTIMVSVINWSDENGDATPNPFGVIYYVPPDPPLNLRPTQ